MCIYIIFNFSPACTHIMIWYLVTACSGMTLAGCQVLAKALLFLPTLFIYTGEKRYKKFLG